MACVGVEEGFGGGCVVGFAVGVEEAHGSVLCVARIWGRYRVFVRCVRDRDKGRCVQWVWYTSARGGGGRVGWLGFVSIRHEAWLDVGVRE